MIQFNDVMNVQTHEIFNFTYPGNVHVTSNEGNI